MNSADQHPHASAANFKLIAVIEEMVTLLHAEQVDDEKGSNSGNTIRFCLPLPVAIFHQLLRMNYDGNERFEAIENQISAMEDSNILHTVKTRISSLENSRSSNNNNNKTNDANHVLEDLTTVATGFSEDSSEEERARFLQHIVRGICLSVFLYLEAGEKHEGYTGVASLIGSLVADSAKEPQEAKRRTTPSSSTWRSWLCRPREGEGG